MNNILSFDEYNGQELETVVYEQELNEKKIVRGLLNRVASVKVKSELREEIKMSKTIMEGIKEGLDSLNDNFNIIKDAIEGDENIKDKGKKQKALEELMAILEKSRKNTWDLNELINEGEIDYAGFTGNVALASVAYFGILFTPFRALVIMHKAYNYFFNIVKNTIRKSLVMLQLNFDQFENLIVTKGFQSADYLQANEASEDISQFYGNITAQLFGDEGKISKTMGKKKSDKIKQMLQAAKNQFDQQMKADKQLQQAESAYNCMDQYNNTYTRSLETLRQYTQDDVQKQLDSIKNSMNKFAVKDENLQAYAELLISVAEEHAYAVSSSIYNKFAKMTEVFSLPNQKKMIDLILDANKEQRAAIKKEREKLKAEKLAEETEKKESDGVELFKKIGGTVTGSVDDETKKYDDGSFTASGATYEEFMKLDEDDRDTLDSWLSIHKEILNKCEDKLKAVINVPESDIFQEYANSLIDYVSVSISEKVIKEAYILNFDEYVFEGKGKDDVKWDDLITVADDESFDDEYEKFCDAIDNKDYSLRKLIEIQDKIKREQKKLSSSDDDKVKEKAQEYNKWISYIKFKLDKKSEDDSEKVYKLNFKKLNDSQISELEKLYDKNEEIAKIALKKIGEFINDKTFISNVDDIIETIKKCCSSKKENISTATANILLKSVKILEDKRNHGYADAEDSSKKSEK